MVALLLVMLAADCPWLSQATAAGVLGGPVTATNCDFVRGEKSLHIEVSEKISSCAHATPLKGIGTEAFACGTDNDAQIVGRVREKAFSVRVKSADAREKARKIAELVAGSLF